MSQRSLGDQRGVPVSEETIQLLVEFKFLEESFTGQACMICKLWICQRFVRRKRKMCSLHDCLFNDFNWYVYVDSLQRITNKYI